MELLLIILTILSVVLAHDIIRPGALFISKLDKLHDDLFLKFEDGVLTAGSQIATFDYDPSGTLKEEHLNKYLNIDVLGQLLSGEKPSTGFRLTKDSTSRHRKTLSYNGDELFQLCGDNSIALKSTCERATLVKIFYEDHIVPR